MSRLSRIAFYVGWIGVAVIVVFVGLLLFRWVDVPSLAVVLPFAIGYGALEVNRRGRDGKYPVVLTTDGATGGPIGRSVARLYRRLLERGEAKLIIKTPGAPLAYEPSAELDPAEWVVRQIRQLKTGRMEIDAPGTGRVGREEKVVVAIGKNEHARIIASAAEGRQLQASAIKVDTFMRVELHGDAFDVTPPPTVDKIVPDDRPVSWEFKIVPKKAGRQILMVHAIVRLRLPGGGEEYYELEPQPHPVVVSIGAMQVVRQWIGTPYVKFAVGAWTTLAATFAALYGIDPVKDRINEWLKPYVDWLFGLFG